MFTYILISSIVIFFVGLFFWLIRGRKECPKVNDDAVNTDKHTDNDLQSTLEHEIERTKKEPLRSVLPLHTYDVNVVVTADPDAYDVEDGWQKCPVCGTVIDGSLEVCPHCHEQIQEVE